ncbi:MAG: TRAP transporter small permease [Burkholderiales bacterium]
MARAYHALVHALAVIAALVLGLIAVLVTIDVLARNLRVGTIPWITEVSEYSLPLATFFVAPWLLDRGEHVRLDIFLQSMGRRAALWTERIADLIGLAVCAVFVFYSVRLIDDSMRIGSMIYKTLEIPEWWTYAPVPLCFALLAIGFLRRLGVFTADRP